jgi:hypothetical protein
MIRSADGWVDGSRWAGSHSQSAEKMGETGEQRPTEMDVCRVCRSAEERVLQ